MDVIGYGNTAQDQSLKPVRFARESLRDGEVAIDITHCGVCHSDLHQARNDWGNTLYPCVPGHEIVGTVSAVGAGVSKVKLGDRVGVGCMVNSCQACGPCEAGDEQYCEGPKSCTLTYNGPKNPDGTNSYGGYSTGIIVREEFVLTIPDALDSAAAAPILCAGITVYQPMKHFGLKAGQTLGVAGVGGLGHMAIRIGKALGARVVAFTTSADKIPAIREMGADDVVNMRDEKAVEAAGMTLDMLISTIPVAHDITPYLGAMKPGSTMVVVGNLMGFENLPTAQLVMNRIAIAGSLIGGIPDTQEVLDLCAQHGIAPEIEMIAIDDVEAVFDKLRREDARFRYVIDMATLRDQAGELASSASEITAPSRGEVVGRVAA